MILRKFTTYFMTLIFQNNIFFYSEGNETICLNSLILNSRIKRMLVTGT